MNKRAQTQIENIMGDAFSRAAMILECEFRNLLDAKPERYSRFVLAVGWGPTLFDAAGKIVEAHDARCCARAKRLLSYADEFYDRYGADNRQVMPTSTQERQAA